jgi:hypothetical protein
MTLEVGDFGPNVRGVGGEGVAIIMLLPSRPKALDLGRAAFSK